MSHRRLAIQDNPLAHLARDPSLYLQISHTHSISDQSMELIAPRKKHKVPKVLSKLESDIYFCRIPNSPGTLRI